MSRVSWTAVFLFLGAAAARVLFFALTRYIADDSFITFRYAENLAYGLGFVYNPGEHVLGTSTPLYTFILALTTLFHIPVVAASLAISLIASGLTTVIVYRYARTLRFTAFAILPAIAYMLWPRSLPADISGMETAVFTFFVTAAFYNQRKHFEVYALGMATLAALTRPEGFGLLLMLLVYNLYRNSRLALVYISTPAIMLLPWLIFASLYFGSPVPNSMTAKLALYSQFGTMSPLQGLVYLLGLHHPLGWLAFVAVIIGAWWIYSKQYTGRLELLWLAVMIIFYAFSRTHLFHWYIAPIYPIYLLFATAVIPWLFDMFKLPSTRRSFAVGASAFLIVVVMGIGMYPQIRYYKNQEEILSRVHRNVGYYLFEKSRPSAIIAAEDIGYSGYYSRRYVLDRDGLVSPRSATYNREGKYLQLILDTRPDFVVASPGSPMSGFIDSTGFTSQYALEKAFAYQTVEYRIYARQP